jgi:hypothetical protein
MQDESEGSALLNSGGVGFSDKEIGQATLEKQGCCHWTSIETILLRLDDGMSPISCSGQASTSLAFGRGRIVDVA